MAIVLPILTTFNSAGINAASSALGGFGSNLKKIGTAAIAASAAVKLISLAVETLSPAVDAARDLNRNLYALDTVFGDLSERMTTFTKNADTMGMSQNQAAKTATFLGSVLKQAGFSMEDTATQTEKLTMLAQDLATTYGYDTSEALTAMTALFRGEYDPIEKFGVALKQNEVNALLAAKGMGDLTGQALLNAQQQVRLEQLYKRSADAQGAYMAQSDTLYGVQTRLNASFENLQATIGQALVPVITDFTKSFIPLVNGIGPDATTAVQGIADVMKTLEPLLKPLAQIIGIVLDLVGRLLTALAPVINLIAAVAAVVLELAADLLTHLASGLIAVADLFVKFAESLNLGDGAGMVMKFIGDFINGSKILKPLLGWIVTTFERINDIASGTTTEATDETSKLIRQRLERLGAIGGGATTPDTNTLGTKTKAKNYIKDFYDSLMDENRKRMAMIRLQNAGASAALAESIVGSGEGWYKVYQSIITGGVDAVAKVQGLFNTTKAGIKELADLAEKAKTPFQLLFSSISDEVAKQNARVTLAGMGASKALVESIVGSGDDWKKLYDEIISIGASGVSALQDQFNKTADGLGEIADAAKKAADDAAEAADKAAEAAKKVADENARIAGIWDEYQSKLANNLKAYQDAVAEADKIYAESVAKATQQAQESMDAMRSSMKSALDAVTLFAQSDEELGKWESKAVAAFEGVEASLKAGLASGALLQDGYDKLSAYAKREMAVLREIGKQRDALAQKKSLVTALMADIKQVISGNVNISSFLIAEAKTVTQTITKMVNGVRVATTTTFETVENQNSIVANFRKLVDGTKAFIANLKQLKALGLNQDLYKQILLQGAEAGGATAQALVDGGANTISEVNGLFKEIGDLGSSLAEQTAQEMYGAGLDLTNGIIAGINAQDALLAETGTGLAKIFAETFKLTLDAELAIAFAKAVADAEEAARKIRDAAKLAALDAKVQADAIAFEAARAAAAWTAAGEAAVNAAKVAAAALAGIKAPASTATPVTVEAPVVPTPEVGNTDDYVLVRPGAAGALGFKGGTSLVDGGTTVNLTVNAGLGTNGAVLGGQIVDLIKKYEKTSGAVFA